MYVCLCVCVDGMENMAHIILQKAIFFSGWISAKSFINENKKTNHIHKKEPKNKKDGKN